MTTTFATPARMTTGPQMIGYIVQVTRIADRLPVYIGVTECSDCPGFQFASQDVTECGPVYQRHWVKDHAEAARKARESRA